ncbi:MAG TPA: pyruvate dehydrogenase (acetyl-transferring) E1 component subunit alpha [Jiangellaceae bacterium]|nr:pyruvate dehydrogenase (acetyl-transferring) E1 component subunit alpha [Jiangellaceae bacterium]
MSTELTDQDTAHNTVQAMLPRDTPVQLLAADGRFTADAGPHPYQPPSVERLQEMYRRMVIGRRVDQQATALTKQGKLAVFPSAHGQEACQVGAVLALRQTDWMFPTYRESMALIARGIPPVEVLSLLRGDWHCGYDPRAHRCAPHATPLATQSVHAAGFAYAEAQQGRDTVALVHVGDGGTSEGDFHEAINFAGVFAAPVVFLVQNNGYAISVPLSQQSAAPSLAYKGIGYGVVSQQVDGNDPAAVLSVLDSAVAHARSGQGPYLVEAHTYRMQSHTNADDATRYRDDSEVQAWVARDPITRLEAHLRGCGALDDDAVTAVSDEAESVAADLREALSTRAEPRPTELFEHVFAHRTPQLDEQRDQLLSELADAREETQS